jgi:hypothetical protein
MLTGRSQAPEGEIAVFGGSNTASNWVAKHAQAVWRLLLTFLTRGYYFESCFSRASQASSKGADAASRTANNDRRATLPPACRMRPCPTRKEAALRRLCRGGTTRTCQIRGNDEEVPNDSSRARATLLIWLQSAWLQTRPTIWTRQASSIPEPSAHQAVRAPRPRGDA